MALPKPPRKAILTARSLRMEVCEERAVPAFYTITTGVDTFGLAPIAGTGTADDPFQVESLRAAVELANASAEADTIVLPEGTYTLRITADSETGNASGDLNIGDAAASGALTISGGGNTPTGTILTTGDGFAHNLFSLSANADLTLHNLTITKGSGKLGGAIHLVGSAATTHLTLDQVIVTENHATAGGAIYAAIAGLTDALDLRIVNSTLSKNSAAGVGGAVAIVQGSGTGTAKLTIAGSIIRDNVAGSATDSGFGGGLYLGGGATLTLLDTLVQGNLAVATAGKAAAGGGLYLANNGSAGATATITNSTLTANKAVGGDEITVGVSGGSASGGGIAIQQAELAAAPVLQLTNSTLSGNKAIGGAGVTVGLGGKALGGGIDAAGGIVTILHTTIIGNAAIGGPVPGELTITGSALGGGIHQNHRGLLTIANSIIAANRVSSTGISNGVDVFGSAKVNNSLIGLGAGLTTTTGSSKNHIGIAEPIDPVLGPLQDNGGPTPTHVPLADSPVIDSGDNSFLSTDLTTDQRGTGFDRLEGTAVDLGAVEVIAAPTFTSPSGTTGVVDPTFNFQVTVNDPTPVSPPIVPTLVPSVGMPPVEMPPVVPPPPPAIDQNRVNTFVVTNGLSATVLNAAGKVIRTINAPLGTSPIVAATADVNGDGFADTILVGGAGSAPVGMVIDTKTGLQIFQFRTFEASFTGGAFVSAGDFNGDGRADIVLTPDVGGAGRTRVLSGKDGSVIADFFGIDDPNFRGGARSGVGDINGDGTPDLIVAAGFGGGPRVAVFDGKSIAAGQPIKLFGDFFVFEESLRNGVFVSAGDLDGDGRDDLVVGGGPGGGPRVFALSGKGLMDGKFIQKANFFAGSEANRDGVRIAVKDLDGDNRADILAAPNGKSPTAYLGIGIIDQGMPEMIRPYLFNSPLNGIVNVG